MDTLKYKEETFDELYDRLSMPVILFDEKARLIKANPSFLHLVKASVDDLKTHSMIFFFNELKSSFDQGLILKVIPEYYITDLTGIDRKNKTVRLYYTKVEKGDGPQEGGLGFIVDLSYLKEMNVAEEKIKALTLENKAYKEQLTGKDPDKILHEKAHLEKDLIETRKFTEDVLESCGDGIFSVNRNGKIVLVNKSFATMLGKKKDEIVGTLAYEMGPMVGTFQSTTGETITLDQSYSDYQTRQIKRLGELLDKAGGKIEHWEFYVLNKKGGVVPLELTVSISKNTEGATIGSVTTARDLTKKRIAEKEIKTSRDFLERVIEASYDGIVVADTNEDILLANSALEKITGYKKELFIDKRFSEVVKTKNITEEDREKLYRELHEKGQISFETFFHNKRGEVVYLEHGITLIKDTESKRTLMVSIIRDITDKKMTATALQDAYQYRSQFFTNITHAFRTPLTLSLGPIEGLLRGEYGNINRNIKEQLSLALRNSRQLLKLIDQLLDFSRMGSDKKTLIYEKKDLKNLVSLVLDSFSFIAKKKKIVLTLVPDSDIPYLSIDPAKVEKVLFNLIGNAFKFTPEKGLITVTIKKSSDVRETLNPGETEITRRNAVTAHPLTRGEYIKISVADTGIGIRRENLKKIFERFTRGDRSFTQKDGGTGIGLAHSIELAELMEGWITVSSKYGKGSTFSIYLPVERSGAEEGMEIVEGADEGLRLRPEIELSDIHPEEEVVADRVSGTKPMVLIIDDNPDVRNYVSGIVKKEYDYLTAGSGPEGLKKLKEHQADVILCDIMMPEMDGYEFLNRVKASPQLKEIPLIFLTARADTEMKVEGLEEGADDYIVKPFNSLELLARIKSLLRIRDLLRKSKVQESTISTLNQKLQGKYSYGNIIGNSPAMRKIYHLLETIRESDSTVLITGETGTGKELIANTIHYHSQRKDGSLVSINCGAIPKELMESEFFGHLKGAYTGAHQDKKGYFEEAHGGSIFLDEIGELDKEVQVKLLRVLESGEITRIGATEPIKVDVRLIAASNKDLRAEVQKGNFREDLYYRIYVIPIQVPPLRERGEDIPLLIENFLKKFQMKLKKEIPSLSRKEMQLFMNYSYPGNVRELEHIVERFCLLGNTAESLFNDLKIVYDERLTDFSYDEILSSDNPLKKAKAHTERDIIIHTLKICNKNYAETAKKLRIGLSSLYRKLKEYGEKS